MNMHKVKNVFTQHELDILHKAISTYETAIDANLGRIRINDIKISFTEDINNRIYEIVKQATNLPLILHHAQYVEYNKKYGFPNLPPHFDGDKNDLIINFQLSSNTSWDLGLNTNLYKIEDNSAIVFNGNTEIHWRPRKEFKNDEYVKMIFMRFFNPVNISDYSHLSNNQSDEIFKSVREIRDKPGLTD
jgi:hypothetical protein